MLLNHVVDDRCDGLQCRMGDVGPRHAGKKNVLFASKVVLLVENSDKRPPGSSISTFQRPAGGRCALL